jgi:anti-sigma regulatory factor (Ser/Thr protein kinase)
VSVSIRTALTIAADPGDFRRASDWLGELGQAHHLPADLVYGLDVCLNEALANVLAHGGEEARRAPIQLSLELHRTAAGGAATLTLRDRGIAFDPLAHVPRAAAASIEDAVPGGQGIVMMREYSDDIRYQREADENRLSFTVRWPGSKLTAAAPGDATP